MSALNKMMGFLGLVDTDEETTVSEVPARAAVARPTRERWITQHLEQDGQESCDCHFSPFEMFICVKVRIIGRLRNRDMSICTHC